MTAPPGGYLEISLSVATPNVAALTALIADVAPGGFTIEEPYVPLGPDEGARFEPWRPTIVRLYLADDDGFDTNRTSLAQALAPAQFEIQRVERLVRAEDWSESWKQFFNVERAGRRLVIRPSWRDYQPREGEIVIDLDPGMAFGTGQHPTTRLCLTAIEETVIGGTNVIDLGCGSGILAIAAAKLGARTVWALDTEAVAADAAQANVAINGVEATIRVGRGSLGDAWPFAEPAQAAADVLVANISAGVLCELAAPIAAVLKPGGLLVGSGIIADRLDEVLVAMAAAGLSLDEIRADGDWRAVVSHKPA